MLKTSLVIMAAGMGSRFGGGIKQLEPMGPHGEIIMDYSIHDAIEAGFDEVVIVTRPDLLDILKETIGNRLEKKVAVKYVFQRLEDIPSKYSVPADRKKPWGTGQAVLACKGVIDNPFLVINADDYYGKKAFRLIHDYLVSGKKSGKEFDFCMAGFILGNTLSDNGTVTRGVCKVDDDMNLVTVTETSGLIKNGDVASSETGDVALDSYVSMNMWGFDSNFLAELERGFDEFLSVSCEDVKSEYLLPKVVDALIKSGRASVKVLETDDKWFGVTYKEDKPVVVESLDKLIKAGLYPENLTGNN
ncbi:MAG: NTP transferase domain-containing protein [Lachnospiraceae bacterium]|nr:NTP transferase domain-containing protein [Lachnospiraceae bacterium]